MANTDLPGTPEAKRAPDPVQTGSEKDTLVQFLDYQRAVFLLKLSRLTDEQLHTTVPPSSMSLGGLLNHMAMVEDVWFSVRFLGNDRVEPWASADWDADWDWEFNSAASTATIELYSRYNLAVAQAQGVVADTDDVATVSKGTDKTTGEPWSMRWILIHMIEEYARHLGHADFLREAIDGETGDFDE